MRHMYGWMLASCILLGSATVAKAQVGVAVGPYTGTSVTIGQPFYGYGAYGAPYYSSAYTTGFPGTTFYSSGYRGYVAPPVTSYYNSGYYGAYAAPVYGYNYWRPYRRGFWGGGFRAWPRRYVGWW